MEDIAITTNKIVNFKRYNLTFFFILSSPFPKNMKEVKKFDNFILSLVAISIVNEEITACGKISNKVIKKPFIPKIV